jgi:hypothetical protein
MRPALGTLAEWDRDTFANVVRLPDGQNLRNCPVVDSVTALVLRVGDRVMVGWIEGSPFIAGRVVAP